MGGISRNFSWQSQGLSKNSDNVEVMRSVSGVLSQAERRLFHHQGWLVVSGLFEPREIARLAEGFETLRTIAHKLWADRKNSRGSDSKQSMIDFRGQGSSRESRFVLASPKTKLETQPETQPGPGQGAADDVIIKRVVWAGGAVPELEHVGADARLVERACALMGVEAVDQLLNQAHFKYPGDGVHFAWHQDIAHRQKSESDWRDVLGPLSYVQTFLALDDTDETSGPVKFIPGSQRYGRLDFGGDGYDEPTDTAGLIDLSMAQTVLAKAGDVIFFGPYVVHGSEPNLGTRPRRVLINGYAAPGANFRAYPGSGLGIRRTV